MTSASIAVPPELLPAADPDPLGIRARGRRTTIRLLALGAAVLVSLVLCMGIGPVSIRPDRVLGIVTDGLGFSTTTSWTLAERSIIFDVRLPRVLLGAAVGACLALCGTALQAMVRNQLADPYVLGISGGASTGAAAAILFGVGAALGEYGQSVLAFVGAMIASLLVLVIARANGEVTSVRLLMAGVAVGYALSALTSLLIFSSDSAEGSRSVMFWMLGSLALGRWNAFLLLTILAAVLGLVVLTIGAPVLDALAAGDETSQSLGISPQRARIGLLVMVSLCTAAAVAAAGSIGFVGLVIPHLARRLVGALHARVIPAAAMLGALFLLWADAVARVVMQPRELPIGVITALVGAPFLLILVRRFASRSG